MQQQNSEFWTKATQAREELASQLQDHPDVCFVDLGYPQDGDQDEIALRIHVCDDGDDFPLEIDGIPVIVARSR
ncbi:MAG: hypothetical protein R3C14_43960 [Caldilineaceae bacterium]